MAIEIIPKTTEEKPFFVNILFYLATSLFVLSVLGSLALFLFQRSADRKLSELKEEIAKQGTAEERAIEKNILVLQDKIEDFSSLLSLHHSNLSFFTVFEGLVHPAVFFDKVDLKIREGRAVLSGKTENFEILGQQLLVFKKEEFVNRVNLLEASIEEEGRIGFTFELIFKTEKFNF